MILALAVSLFFYLFLPGIGAFVVRSRWRLFRRHVSAATAWPILSYRDVHSAENENREGTYRFYGTLESLEGDFRIWLNDGAVTAGVDLKRVSIFVLPQGGMRAEEFPDATPSEYRWHELSAIPEGTRFFVAGRAVHTPGGMIFGHRPGNRVLVVVHECPAAELYPRAIWTGRQRNEYWNTVTPPSLAAGFLANLTLALVRSSTDLSLSLFGVVLAVLPFLPLIPPGSLGFLVYRRLWRFARRLRSERDVVRMPMAYRFRPLWPGTDVAETPAGGRYYHVSRWEPRDSVAAGFGRPRGGGFGGNRSGPRHLFVRGRSAVGDPMPPEMISAGDPLTLARQLTRRASAYEMVSGIAFAAGLVTNTVLLVAILRSVFR